MKKSKIKSILIQISKDYDLPLWKVTDVYIQHGLGLIYEKLEELLLENTDWQDCTPTRNQ